MDYYGEHFEAQTGGGGLARTGYGGISHVYIGSPNQRGHGIGSFLGGLFRSIIPLLKQGARAVGKEALRSGMNVASDILDNGVKPRDAFKVRLRESGQNLKRKAEEKMNTLMQGSGYKPDKIMKMLHSASGSVRRRIGAKKKKFTSTKTHGRVKKKKNRKKGGKTAVRRRTKTKTRGKKKASRTVADIFA